MASIQTKKRIRLTCVWRAMKARCSNPKVKEFHNYGGRGIAVCDKWLKLRGFLEDMQPSYSSGLTLDRIDVDGNYCKENCRWVSRGEQQRNRRNNRRFKGKLLVEWAEELGIKRSTLAMRIYCYKWPVERALSN